MSQFLQNEASTRIAFQRFLSISLLWKTSRQMQSYRIRFSLLCIANFVTQFEIFYTNTLSLKLNCHSPFPHMCTYTAVLHVSKVITFLKPTYLLWKRDSVRYVGPCIHYVLQPSKLSNPVYACVFRFIWEVESSSVITNSCSGPD